MSRATVFNSVGGKPDLLRAAYRRAVRGPEPDTPLGEQARSRKILELSSARRMLTSYAGVCAAIAPRLAPIYEAVRAGAGTDPDARQLWEELQGERRFGAGRVVDAVAALGAVRPGLTRSSAGDILFVLNDPGLHTSLVGECGWSRNRYRRWLGATMQEQLLEPGSD